MKADIQAVATAQASAIIEGLAQVKDCFNNTLSAAYAYANALASVTATASEAADARTQLQRVHAGALTCTGVLLMHMFALSAAWHLGLLLRHTSPVIVQPPACLPPICCAMGCAELLHSSLAHPR